MTLQEKLDNNIALNSAELKSAVKAKLNVSHANISQITDMSNVFDGIKDRTYLKQLDLSRWDVSHVTRMNSMFASSSFNGDISKWNVSNVTSMPAMFGYSVFNSDISQWDVSNVTNMRSMFSGAVYRKPKFNQDISQWNVSKVTNMSKMFVYSIFNNDISQWDVSNVTDMGWMFYDSQFNRNISKWDLSSLQNSERMFDGALRNRLYRKLELKEFIKLTEYQSTEELKQKIQDLEAGKEKYELIKLLNIWIEEENRELSFTEQLLKVAKQLSK